MTQYVSIHFQITNPAGSPPQQKQTYVIPTTDPNLEVMLNKIFGDLANMINLAGAVAQQQGPNGQALPYNPIQAGHGDTSFPPT